MTAQNRLNMFARLLGLTRPVFNNLGDAEAFVDLTKGNTVMSQFKTCFEFINDKVHVKIDDDSAGLTWASMSEYTINKNGIVN